MWHIRHWFWLCGSYPSDTSNTWMTQSPICATLGGSILTMGLSNTATQQRMMIAMTLLSVQSDSEQCVRFFIWVICSLRDKTSYSSFFLIFLSVLWLCSTILWLSIFLYENMHNSSRNYSILLLNISWHLCNFPF